LIALVFLPPAKIPSAFIEVKNKLEHESGIENLIKWFKDNPIFSVVKEKPYEMAIVHLVLYHYFFQNYVNYGCFWKK